MCFVNSVKSECVIRGHHCPVSPLQVSIVSSRPLAYWNERLKVSFMSRALMWADVPWYPRNRGIKPAQKKNETLYSLQEDLAVSWCWLFILPRNTGTFLPWDLGRYLKESHERTRQILDVNPRLISIRKLIWASDGITIWWESPNSNPFYDFVTIVIRQDQKNAMCNFEYLIISLRFIEYQTG